MRAEPNQAVTAHWMRRLALGRLAYHVYHAPLGAVRRSVRAGGPLEQWRTASGRRAMERAAHTLAAPDDATGRPPVPVHLLTGRRFWYQTAFCLFTLARHSGRTLAPVIYDDGSLSEENRTGLQRAFPLTRFVPQAETLANLDARLPVRRFPTLRERWLNYPNIRKLLDVHVGGSGWKLVLDSDLLFFRRPDFLLAWLEAPAWPLHAVDVETSYGYSHALLEQLANARLRARVNVGLCGLRSDALDWERIEFWCRSLIAREGTSYYLEQALVAMLTAGHDCAIAPETDYVTLPCPAEAATRRAVMHHYVADSKVWYFRHNWQAALQRTA